MEISVRSYLTAGVAAVVGATAIGLAPTPSLPTIRAAELPATMATEIALTGTSIPWDTIVEVVKTLSGGGSLQGVVTSLIGEVGTEFVHQAMPLVTAVAGDVVKYLGAALADLFSGPNAPQIDFPAIVDAAVEAVKSGDFSTAVKTLTAGLSAPLTQIGQVLFTPDFQAFLMTKVGTVLGALPELLRSAVQTVVGIDLKPLIDALGGVLGGLFPAASTLTAGPAAAALAVAAPLAAASVSAPVVAEAPAPEAPEAPAAEAPAAEGPVADAPEAAAKAAPAAEVVAPAAEPEAAAAPITTVEEIEAPVVAEVEASVVAEIEAPAAVEDAVAHVTTAAEETAAPADAAPAAPTRQGRAALRSHGSSDVGAKAGAGARSGRG